METELSCLIFPLIAIVVGDLLNLRKFKIIILFQLVLLHINHLLYKFFCFIPHIPYMFQHYLGSISSMQAQQMKCLIG